MHKIEISCRAHEARALSDGLGGLETPTPVAVTWFERVPDQPEWVVEAYFLDPVTADEIAQAIVNAAGLAITADQISVGEVIEENWVARVQSELAPVAAGRYLVHGSHDRHRARGYRGALWIDAGEAFGTAHHATTEGCLIALDQVLRVGQPRRMLDLGTGSAVLAIAVARMAPAVRVLATDIDPQAIEVARNNCALNCVAGRIDAITAGGLDHPALRAGRFDLITANILAQPLLAFAPQLVRRLTLGGRVILSGLVDEQAAAMISRYNSLGTQLVRRISMRGWTTLIMQKRQ